MNTSATVVVVPIYKRELDALEAFSLSHSLAVLGARHTVCFIAPHQLDVGWYAERHPGVPVLRFDDAYFASIKGYNLLMLSPDFYREFAAHQDLLVLQTDAVLLRDELDAWAARPFDYVGAPWPDGLEIRFEVDRWAGADGRRLRAHVGNGGLSLRRIAPTIALLDEFPQALALFRASGSSEDLFFAWTGQLSRHYLLPNETVASTFAMELRPSHYLRANGGQEPMGGHAWWKYEPGFWADRLPLPEALRQQLMGLPAEPAAGPVLVSHAA